jgi:hypothetical protein
MTAITRGSQPAERMIAASSRDRGETAAADPSTVSGRTSADPAASSRVAIRGRLAERMAEIAGKAASQAQTPSQSPPPQPAPAPATAAAPAPQTAQQPAPQAAKPKPKKKTPPSGSLVDRLKAEHQSLLRTLHERVLDASREQLFFVPTKEPQALSKLTINSPNRAAGHDYRPVPCQVFDWALDQIPEDVSDFTFVDYGAGKGRAMLLAAERPFAAVAGVEFAAELHDNAEMNIAQYPRSKMLCRNVECILEDAVQVGPPDGASVHYFFNPFAREVFAEVLDNIVMAYRMTPRRLYLILIDPVATDLVEASGVFARVEPSQIDDLKLKLLSPHTVAVYRSLA